MWIKEYPFVELMRDRNGSRTTILKYLIEKYGVCYHCNKNVHYRRPTKGQKPSHDSATIDHLVSRFIRKKGEKVPKVLSCYKCNQTRARLEDIKYSKNEIYRRQK